MTEAEWVSCNEPDDLLGSSGNRLTVRKVLLLACACCRALHWRFTDLRAFAAVEAAERFADRAVAPEALRLAATEAQAAWRAALTVRYTVHRTTHAGETTAMTASRLLEP